MPPVGSPKIVRVAGQLFWTVGGDEEVVLDAQASAAFPVRAGLDREHHAFLDRSGSSLMRIGRLVCTRANAVRNRMRRLTRVARRGKALADQDVELGKTRARATMVERTPVDV